MAKPSICHCSPFSADEYIRRVTADLRANGVVLPSIPEGGPVEVRSAVSTLLQDAVASLESIDIPTFAAIRQLDACVSKLESFGASSREERKSRALDKFHLAESSCRRTNRRLRWYSSRMDRLPRMLSLLLTGAQHRVHTWLAEPMGFDEFERCEMGPGVTYGLDGEERHLIWKIGGDQTTTVRARQLALEVLQKLYPRWMEYLAASGRSLDCVKGNRITFVPKSSSIYRTIAVEPSLNVLLQNGIDKALRRRVRPFGLTLDDQGRSVSKMRQLFDEGRCATIDLSSASDSVARETVRWFLPADWYRLCDTVRSPEYTLGKGQTWHIYEKFSSMGNGTTFPIESIIFYALALEATALAGGDQRSVRVYGDDIVCEPRAALLLIEGLRFLGFRTNTDKTFLFGRFRECCGVDILDNQDVRPVYLRSAPKQADEVASLFNRLAYHRFGFAFPAAGPVQSVTASAGG